MTRRPALSDEERAEIAELREERGWSEPRIAEKVGVSLGSVSWFLLTQGIEKPGAEAKALPPIPAERVVHQRNGRPVVRYTIADDAQLLALEAEGLPLNRIGRMLDPPRRPNSVRGRLATLARHAARAEAQS